LDLNGTNLFTGTTPPDVTLNGQSLTFLSMSLIPGTNMQQVIFDLPPSLLAGTYKVKLNNTQAPRTSEFHLNSNGICLDALKFPAGLVGYWPLDGDYDDASGNGIDGFEKGGLDLDVVGAKGCKAGTFNGADQYVELGNNANTNITGSITLAGWIKTTNTASRERVIIGKHQSGNTVGYFLELWTDGRAAIWTSAGGVADRLIGTTAVNDGNWHHVAATYDGFTKLIYVDGVEQNNRAITGALIITSTTLKIGAFSNPPISHFPDLIDDVAIWNRALTAAEVFDLFN